jgi:O-antigen/teichoic acid export membrane protein
MSGVTERAAADAGEGTAAGDDTAAAARGTIQLIIARFVFLGSGLVISIVLARGLGPAEFGVYGVIMTVLTWVEMMLGASVPGAVANLLPKHADNAAVLEQTAFLLLIASSLVLFGVCWFIAPFAADLFNMPDGAFLFRLALVDLPLMSVFFAYQGIFYGYQRFGILSLALILQTLSKLVGILILIWIGMSVTGALVAHVLATVCVIAYLVVRFPPVWAGWSMALARSIVLIALPLCIYAIAMQAHSNMGLWFLKSLSPSGAEATGFYAAALNVTRALTVVQSALSGVLFASLSWAFARSDYGAARRYIQGATRFALLLLAPACVLLTVDAPAIVQFLFAEKYGPAAAILPYQLFGFACLTLLDLFFQIMMAYGRFLYCAGILLGLVPVGVLLNIVLIPLWGGAGAALALLLTVAVGAAIAAAIAGRQFGWLVAPATALRIGIAALVLIPLALQVPASGAWLLLKLPILFGVYVLILILLREITAKDLQPFALWQRQPS